MANLAYIMYQGRAIGSFTSDSLSIELKTIDTVMADNIKVEYNFDNYSHYNGEVSGITLVNKPTNTAINVIADGTEKTNGYTCPTGVTMTGQDRGTTMGTYTAVYSLNDGYMWSDYTLSSVTVILNIYNWEFPVLTGDELSMTQVMDADQTGNILEVE